MLSNLYTPLVAFFITVSSFLSALDYEIRDIGTLQTHSSNAIAINNEGQILGWYNIDGSREGKHFFVRDRDGSLLEVPNKENGVGCEVEWRYLTNDGTAYGVFDGNTNFAVLYKWDANNGVVKLGNLPGKEISAINDAGQVLIKSIVENEGGKSIRRPVIWNNGKITKLHGLEGDLGIESDESYGYGMNNNGDVVGQSVVFLSYKNNIYKQLHATMWVDGQPIDLHDKMEKSLETIATAITDQGEVLIGGMILRQDGSLFNIGYGAHCSKMTSKYVCYKDYGIYDVSNRRMIHPGNKNSDPIWFQCTEINSVNDKGEAIAKGKTIYGEDHAMLLVPVKAD